MSGHGGALEDLSHRVCRLSTSLSMERHRGRRWAGAEGKAKATEGTLAQKVISLLSFIWQTLQLEWETMAECARRAGTGSLGTEVHLKPWQT